MVKRWFTMIALSAAMMAGTTSCLFDADSGRIILVTGSEAFPDGLSLGPGDVLRVNTGADGGTTVLTITGDFVCAGDIVVIDFDTILRILVSGDAFLSCDLFFPGMSNHNPPLSLQADSPQIIILENQLEVVVDGQINITNGFSPFTHASTTITDDISNLMDPQTFHDDALTDDPDCGEVGDPTCELIHPPDEDDELSPTSLPGGGSSPLSLSPQACVSGATHQISGTIAPPAGSGSLDQSSAVNTPIVLAVWTECDVQWNTGTVNPPSWANRPPKTKDTTPPGGGGGAANENGANGRKGLTMNINTKGTMKFCGPTSWNLMDGADGQSVSVTGHPATATGGDGGKSGDLKARAGGGFDFTGAGCPAGSGAGTLVINPGSAGDGGDASATGLNGVIGCPGTVGCDATATGGDGADNKKNLRVRGFDPTGVVSLGSLWAGDGGDATATAGRGGDGLPGCDGGDGGNADGDGGDGGDAKLTYSGAGSVGGGQTIAGWGGDATSTSGAGGDGGDFAPHIGGDGGDGGDSAADSGAGGDANGGTDGIDGTPDADQAGDGGLCGICFGVNGSGGAWSTAVDGSGSGGGPFADGARDCDCPAPPPPLPIPESEPSNNSPATPDDIDTIINRGQGEINPGGSDQDHWRLQQVPIEIVELKLCSVNPIDVTPFQLDLWVDTSLTGNRPPLTVGAPQDVDNRRCWDIQVQWLAPGPWDFLFQFQHADQQHYLFDVTMMAGPPPSPP